MYAYLPDAPPDVLLYAGPGMWVVRPGFLTPTRRTEVGFVLCLETTFWETAASPD
jgi:hypothetical protein